MNSTTDAAIAIRRPFGWRGSWYRLGVLIDGHRVGKIKSATTEEFKVEPGMHTVALKQGWPAPKPSLQVSVEARSTTRLAVHDVGSSSSVGLKQFLPLFPMLLSLPYISDRLLAMMALGNPRWWVDMGVQLLVAGVIWVTYALVTAALFPRYWVFWELKAEETTSPAD